VASAGRVRAEVPKEGSNVRTYELTADGYFAGVDGGGVLVARKKDWKYFRVHCKSETCQGARGYVY
jgi:hypothetical protein